MVKAHHLFWRCPFRLVFKCQPHLLSPEKRKERHKWQVSAGRICLQHRGALLHSFATSASKNSATAEAFIFPPGHDSRRCRRPYQHMWCVTAAYDENINDIPLINMDGARTSAFCAWESNDELRWCATEQESVQHSAWPTNPYRQSGRTIFLLMHFSSQQK